VVDKKPGNNPIWQVLKARAKKLVDSLQLVDRLVDHLKESSESELTRAGYDSDGHTRASGML